ncbi:homing endonuclease [Vibrio phage D479]
MKKYHYTYKTTICHPSKGDLIYVGKHSTDNLDDGYLGSGKILLAMIAKYGRDIASLEVADMHLTESAAYEAECQLISETVQSYPNTCLNLTGFGGRYDYNPDKPYERQPFQHDEAAKAKMSKSRFGKKQSTETKAKRAASHRGRKNTTETKQKMRESRLKVAQTQEHKDLVSGENHPKFKGWYHTPLGKFPSANQAAKAYNTKTQCIINWCKTTRKPEFWFEPKG